MDPELLDYRFSAYRRFRRGIVALPVLENQLETDLAVLSGVLKKGTASSFEPFFISQIIKSVQELADETAGSLAVLRQYFDADPFFNDTPRMKEFAAKNIIDKGILETVNRILDETGGVQKLLGGEQKRLEGKQKAYASALALAKTSDAPSSLAAIDFVEKYRTTEQAHLASIMSNKDLAYRDSIAAELAIGRAFHKNEETSKQPELQVAALIPVLIVIVIGCALLCAHD